MDRASRDVRCSRMEAVALAGMAPFALLVPAAILHNVPWYRKEARMDPHPFIGPAQDAQFALALPEAAVLCALAAIGAHAALTGTFRGALGRFGSRFGAGFVGGGLASLLFVPLLTAPVAGPVGLVAVFGLFQLGWAWLGITGPVLLLRRLAMRTPARGIEVWVTGAVSLLLVCRWFSLATVSGWFVHSGIGGHADNGNVVLLVGTLFVVGSSVGAVSAAGRQAAREGVVPD